MSAVTPLRLLLAILMASVPGQAFAEKTSPTAALDQGRADDAIGILRTQLQTRPEDALTHQLLCRALYSIELEDAAIRECEAAVANAPSSSDDYLWLGRSYGLKASRTNPVSAFRLARKVVAAFEHAVSLDPQNAAAMSDLGEFYVGAPPIVGGGLGKAQQLAARMMLVSPTRAHRLLALIAEKKGNPNAAETEFKRAVEARPSPNSYVDLAAFYQRQKRIDECVDNIQTAVRLDRARDAALVDAASVLTDAGRAPQLAQQLLIAYLASSAKSDEAPAGKVHVQLGDLLLKSGDQTGARHEYQAALAVASSYAPAKKALQALPANRVP